MQKRARGEGHGEGGGLHRRLIGDTKTGEQRLEAMGEEGFADPAEAETGEGDAELRGGEGGIEVLGGAERELHAPATLAGERAELARAHLDEGELRRDEEAIGRDERDDHQTFQCETEKWMHAVEK